MITQGIIDFLVGILVGVLELVPQPPASVMLLTFDALAAWSSLLSSVANLGVLIPFELLGVAVAAFGAYVAFWASLMVIRFLLWAVNR